jgi:hypothetical protein
MIDTIRIRRIPLVRKLTTTLSAVALALAGMTAVAVPARANDDLAKFLLGATAVVIIGSAIANSNRAHAQPQPRHDVHKPQRRDDHARHGRDDRNHGHRAPVLPAACAISISGHNSLYFGARCLDRQGPRVAYPARCERTMNTHRGPRAIYDGQCLVNAGFRIEGNRSARR